MLPELSYFKGRSVLYFSPDTVALDVMKALQQYPEAILILGGPLAPEERQKPLEHQGCSMLIQFNGKSPSDTGIHAAILCNISEEGKTDIELPPDWKKNRNIITAAVKDLGSACKEKILQRSGNVENSSKKYQVLLAPELYHSRSFSRRNPIVMN